MTWTSKVPKFASLPLNVSFLWPDKYILKIQIKHWKVWDHRLHPCTCHSPWHPSAGSELQGFTQPMQVKGKWTFGFSETNNFRGKNYKRINLSHRSNSWSPFQSVCVLLVAKNFPSPELKSLFGDTNEQVTRRLAAIFYYNEIYCFMLSRQCLLAASSSS